MIRSLCTELQFPREAAELFARLDAAVMSNPAWRQMLQEAKEDYMAAGQRHLSLLETLAAQLGIAPATANMILLLRLALELRPLYAQKGYSDRLYLESMYDLRYKMMEARQVSHVWANLSLKWYRPFFQCSRFSPGRLQYEVRPWSGPDFEPWLTHGQDAYICHIPSSGPCRPEDVVESLSQAYHIYGIQGIFAIGCHSWLLYPPHLPLFPLNSNLEKFQKNFLILDQEEREYTDLWRIFGVPNDTDLMQLPEETTLQRRFAPWLRQGNKIGCSHCLLLFDGERILTIQE